MIITQLATSVCGSIVAAGGFEHAVQIWDLDGARQVAAFDTVLDFGGTRLAVTADGKHCFAAAHNVEGVVAYSTFNGTGVWRRKDLKKTQTIRVSLDDCRIYCCFDESSCQVLNCDTGKTIKKWPGVRDVWESPYEPVMLVEKRALVLQTPGEQKISTIARETFAVLCAAFAPGLVCVSESTGALRCLDVQTGEEVWRYAQEGEHFLRLTYAEDAKAFFGVCWPYKRGGSHRLHRFEPRSGEACAVSDLGASGVFAFCRRGSRLLLSDGSVLNTANGHRELVLSFPASRGGGGVE